MAMISSSGVTSIKGSLKTFFPTHSKGGLHATFSQDVTFRFPGEGHQSHGKRMVSFGLFKDSGIRD